MMNTDRVIEDLCQGRWFSTIENTNSPLGRKTYWVGFIDNPQRVGVSWDEESTKNPAFFSLDQITDRFNNSKWFFTESENAWRSRKFRTLCSCGECRQYRSGISYG